MNHRLLSLCAVVGALVLVGLLAVLVPHAAAKVGRTDVAVQCASEAFVRATTEITTTPPYTSYLPVVRNASCRVGTAVDDALDDVTPAHTDIVRVSTQAGTDTLIATFTLRDVPPDLPFNRSGVPRPADPNRCTVEYSWEIWVDVDNNRATGGPQGHEYILLAWNCVRQGMNPVTRPISNGVEQVVWEWHGPCPTYPYCYYVYEKLGQVGVDASADTLTLYGSIPGISAASVYVPFAFDYNPGGPRQLDSTECGVF
jgi:hypothetical protein